MLLLNFSVRFELHLQGAEDLVYPLVFAADVDNVVEHKFFFVAGWANVEPT